MNLRTTIRQRPAATAAMSALLLACGLSAGPAALAAEPELVEFIVVEVARPTTTVIGRTATNVPIEALELRAKVSYADLDLSTNSGAETLKSRVAEAAKITCRDLDRLFPFTRKNRACAREATETAMVQVTEAIAKAKTRS